MSENISYSFQIRIIDSYNSTINSNVLKVKCGEKLKSQTSTSERSDLILINILCVTFGAIAGIVVLTLSFRLKQLNYKKFLFFNFNFNFIFKENFK